MKNSIRKYDFYKNKYGSELLIDVVELQYVKKHLPRNITHTLTYYDITFITEGEGTFFVDNQTYRATVGDVIFSRPGEIRNWDITHIGNGYALIFEACFLTSFFKDPLFVQHLPYFSPERTVAKLHLTDELYRKMLRLLHDIKNEIGTYRQNDTHLLRALLYEALMQLNRSYQILPDNQNFRKEGSSLHLHKFIELVSKESKTEHTVQYFADKLCITPNYLNEIVNSAMGLSPKQYIRNQVMDEAKRLLVYTDIPISEIAFELHFSTVSYFVRSFKKSTGETPLSYRNKHKP